MISSGDPVPRSVSKKWFPPSRVIHLVSQNRSDFLTLTVSHTVCMSTHMFKVVLSSSFPHNSLQTGWHHSPTSELDKTPNMATSSLSSRSILSGSTPQPSWHKQSLFFLSHISFPSLIRPHPYFSGSFDPPPEAP